MRALLELYVKNNPDIELTLEKKTVETINIVFDNISKIITIHTKFSKLLNDKIANWHETQEVGQIFIDFVRLLVFMIFFFKKKKIEQKKKLVSRT